MIYNGLLKMHIFNLSLFVKMIWVMHISKSIHNKELNFLLKKILQRI